MDSAENTEKMSPEQLTAMLDSFSPRVLLEFIKGDAAFAQTIFHGFTVRENSLKNPVVRTRLKQELSKSSEIAHGLRVIWDEANADLLEILATDEFIADAASIALLYATHNEAALRFALLCDARDEVNAWAERLGELRKQAQMQAAKPVATTPQPVTQKSDAEARAQVTALHKDLLTAQQEIARLRSEVTKQQHATAAEVKRTEELQRKLEEVTKQAKEKLERETRRAKKAEEEALELRKQQRVLEKQLAEKPALASPAQLNTAAAPV
ncbi:MAG: hypothetical protein WCJ56_05445, partial [bacterium]